MVFLFKSSRLREATREMAGGGQRGGELVKSNLRGPTLEA